MQKIVLAATLCLMGTNAVAAITVETVPVDNLDSNTLKYHYRIGKYDVTVGQYAAFLNAVAATDTYGLYDSRMATDLNVAGIAQNGSSGSYTYSVIDSPIKPITYVSWGDAVRFTNWLYNGQPTGAEGNGTTETGSYTLNGATGYVPLDNVQRNSNATWVLPTEDEWVKAAYYDPASRTYYQYPTSSNTAPTSAPPGSTPNTANIFNNGYAVTGSGTLSPNQNYLTDVGAYTASASPYGAYDLGGNVLQWNESATGPNIYYRDYRGMSWNNGNTRLIRSDSNSIGNYPTTSSPDIGFRVALLPGLLAGDFNRDNAVDYGDIRALELALTNLTLYKDVYHISDSDFAQISQLPGKSNSTLRNSDLQLLLNIIKAGGSSADPVPEPASYSLALLAFGGFVALAAKRR